MDHHLLQVRSEGLLGSGIQDLIPGFHLDRRLQRILRIGAVLMMDPDLNVQNSEIVIGNVLYLGVEPALEELQVDPETSILIYPAMARNQGEGKIARGMTAEDGMTEMNADMTGTG
jgi:hypothetical protein